MAGRTGSVAAVVVATALLAAACSGGGTTSGSSQGTTTQTAGGQASGVNAPMAAALSTTPTVVLHVQLGVGGPDDPVTASVTASPTALQAKVKGDKAPGGPSPANLGTDVGALSIVHGTNPGVAQVDVLAYLNGRSLDGTLNYDWTIQGAPGGSQAQVQAATTATPTFAPDLLGTYDLQLAVHDPPAAASGPSSEQPVVVSAVPGDPPIGVPIQTVASDSGQIAVDNNVLDRTGNAAGLNYAVLERRTREVVASGSGDVGAVAKIANDYGKPKNLAYLMVVNSPKRAAGPDYAGLLASLGVGQLSATDADAFKNGAPFSVLGIPGAPAGAAWYSISLVPGQANINVSGNLQVNLDTNQYDFVSPEHPSFDTHAAGSTDQANVIVVGGKTFTATMQPGGGPGAAGFHVLAVDPKTLQPIPGVNGINNRFSPTNGYNPGDRALQANLAALLGVLEARRPAPLIIMQSMGNPKPAGPEWARIAAALQPLGANPALFNGLTGSGGYALVGRDERAPGAPTGTLPAAESSSSIGQSGRLTGIMARNRAFGFGPQLSDSPDRFGTLNTDLVSIAYQPSTPFPPFDTDQQKAADDYLGRFLGFCTPRDPGDWQPGDQQCDVRRAYYQSYPANWTQKSIDIVGAPLPANAKFTQADLDAVKAVLKPEISAVSNVQDYLNKLEAPFVESTSQAFVDLQGIGAAVQKAVSPPPAASSKGLQIFAAFLGVAGAAAGFVGQPELKSGLDAISSLLSLAASLSAPDGTDTLPAVIEAKTAELGPVVQARFNEARKALTILGLLIVSDYGKLKTAASKVNSDWNLPPLFKTQSVDAIRVGASAWYYQTLLPVAYPNLLQLNSGPPNARDFYCFTVSRGLRATHQVTVTHPVGQAPDSVQDPQAVGFGPDGTPVKPVIALAGRRVPRTSQFPTPPASLIDPLFAPAGPGKKGLGLNKTEFFSNQIWPNRVQLTQYPASPDAPLSAERCGLPFP